ncbi:hypothetical protein C7446_2562 [Kushneria sinocarnis]|uniref:DUF2213 domain-containing protein n=1 Tax=Kushneria sinocarnis TaxID=595502 RepID=A0A420WUP5_9GAMM|nr:DUF2213 domain-containing protein [Kushneria sinocarnis]RKQ97142.1 hypothetical protein C7446_2562 [Kushneria sinocarnis]
MSVNRYDRVAISARYDENGYLEDSPVLTRTGVFVYRDGNGQERRELRRADDVFSSESLASYRNKPITKGHPGKVNAGNVRSHQIGTVTTEGRQDGDNVVSDVVIHDPRVIRQDGWKELSVGYSVDLIEEPGEYNGERYDAIQTNIRVNHLAVVSSGRAGNSRLNLDGSDAATLTDDEDDPVMEKVRLDSGIEYDAAPEVAQAYRKAREDAQQASDATEKEKARADAAEKAKKEAEDSAEKLKQDAVKDARARLELEAAAKEHKVEVKEDSTDRALKESVIKSVNGDSDLSQREDAYIDAMFDIVKEQSEKSRNDAAEQRRQATPTQSRQDGAGSKASARDRMISRMKGETVEGDNQ